MPKKFYNMATVGAVVVPSTPNPKTEGSNPATGARAQCYKKLAEVPGIARDQM